MDDGNCSDTAQITITIIPLPTANDVALDLCEDAPGGGSVAAVDLTTNEAAINGGGGIAYSYFEDLNLTVPVATPGNVTVTNGDDFFVLVDDGTCTDTAQIDYTVFTQATVNAAAVTTVIIPGGTIDPVSFDFRRSYFHNYLDHKRRWNLPSGCYYAGGHL